MKQGKIYASNSSIKFHQNPSIIYPGLSRDSRVCRQTMPFPSTSLEPSQTVQGFIATSPCLLCTTIIELSLNMGFTSVYQLELAGQETYNLDAEFHLSDWCWKIACVMSILIMPRRRLEPLTLWWQVRRHNPYAIEGTESICFAMLDRLKAAGSNDREIYRWHWYR